MFSKHIRRNVFHFHLRAGQHCERPMNRRRQVEQHGRGKRGKDEIQPREDHENCGTGSLAGLEASGAQTMLDGRPCWSLGPRGL